MDLYASKSRITGSLAPLTAALAVRGVAPDAVTLAALPVAAAAAVSLLVSHVLPPLLLVVPLLAAVRLVLNLLDGALARATGRTHPRGELYNEVGDRAADVLFLAPVAWLPGAPAQFVLLGVIGAVLASYVGVVSRAAGGRRLYMGVLSKPGRMVLIAIAAIAAFVVGETAWTWFGLVLCVGVALTLLHRLILAVGALP
jgi:phosphatidylglycerophosphate synthase